VSIEHNPLVDRAGVLQEEYTEQLGKFVDEIVPPVLDNAEYAARCSALLVALNRQLARCAASMGDVHGIEPAQMAKLVIEQFIGNHNLSLAALQGQGPRLQ
jgi:hypothetical protein